MKIRAMKFRGVWGPDGGGKKSDALKKSAPSEEKKNRRRLRVLSPTKKKGIRKKNCVVLIDVLVVMSL
jgi:hypothetical protein